ncbi:glycine--tRNA ligase subunit beta [Elstera cyanobacteriorum]|uniref:glycine--tRNA ligase subunit beta n=1 Tax=Elstera cyanobacteriorum TaxID=2022747 RepID=UPI0023553F76|nr:glycine--tRNA ligase subunit beta [Elstera cyanobacteriorum]MCK6444664.1 glycine--tRNA ligase subunit beta [Elstera cyanobacteriorum]
MADLLLELFSEEIPARMQARAAEELKDRLTAALTDAGLTPASVTAWVTPRRVAFHVTGLPTAQPDRTEERKGPRADAPDGAIQGFLKSTGLTRDQLETRETDKGAVLFAVTHIQGRATREVLPELICGLILGYTWPKSMRWRDTRLAWVRPLRSILALFDGQGLPGGLHLGRNVEGGEQPGYRAVGSADDLNYLPFGTTTYGHRFLAPAAITVADAAEYQAKLRAASVLLDREERKRLILAEAEKLAESVGCRLKPDAGLLEEVAGLVEWPVPLLGRIDDAFMDVPAEVLTTSMREHQKYFALTPKDAADGDTRIAAYFITVANMVAADGGAAIISGNQRVLRARLSDARFFWDQDRKVPLEAWAEKLQSRVFHAKLGTVQEKVRRTAELAEDLRGMSARKLGDGSQTSQVDDKHLYHGLLQRAVRLSKADLSTGMVGEFPELQGVIGRYYALHQKEKEAVAHAIAEHYAPLGPTDRVPTARVSYLLALADKIDLLTGMFFIDERPTGSKDPYALRRAALGILRIIVENRLRFDLREGIAAAYDLHADGLTVDHEHTRSVIVSAVLSFMMDRLRVMLRDQGQRHDLIQAVFALGTEDDVVRLLARVTALSDFIATPVGADMLAAYRRAANILKIEEKKDGRPAQATVSTPLLAQAEEKALAEALSTALPAVEAALAQEQFVEAMTRLGALRDPVDAFFTHVTVNADDAALRANRLALLAQIRQACSAIADFGLIEG